MSRVLPLAFIVLASALRAAPPTAAEIAARLDDLRRPAKSFQVRVKLTEIRDGMVDTISEFDVFARKVGGYPDFDTLARCLQPESDKGKVLLTRGTNAWVYDPKSSRPVSISYEKMRSKFFVSYGLTSSFVQEYDATLLGAETILDAARKERSCLHLDFTHRDGGRLAPGNLHYWVDAENLRPVRGQIHSASGRLLRTAYYTRFQKLLGRERPTRLLVVSGVERGLLTDVEFSQLAYREMPAEEFMVDAMPAFSRTGAP
jgi:outer membrane lipoprotein-sorting protein